MKRVVTFLMPLAIALAVLGLPILLLTLPSGAPGARARELIRENLKKLPAVGFCGGGGRAGGGG